MRGSEQQPELDKLAQASFDLTTDAFYWMREDGRFVLINAAACKQLGYSSEQLLGMTVFDIDNLMTREKWNVHWQELTERRSFSTPSVHRRADGTVFPVEVTVNYITTTSGAFNCAMVRDTTAQEEQRVMIELHEALKTATIDCALDSVISINEQGAIVEFNPAAEATFGHLKSEILGRQLSEVVIPHEMRAAHNKGFQTYLDTGIGPVLNKRLELQALHANGSTFPIEIAISPINVAGRQMFTAYIRNITQRKQSELALTDARAAAERANAYKSRFLAQMSHEIRTPLTAIVGYADLLTHSQDYTEAQLDWGVRIQDNTRYLLSLVNDILDLSKIEAGESKLHTTQVDLAATLRSVDAMLRPQAVEKLIDFRIEFTTAIPSQAQIDGTKLKQVIVNLAVNAIRATSKGHVGIRMSVTAPSQTDEAECTVEVYDTGCGIEKAFREKVFRPFVQIESQKPTQSSEQSSETGLGLAISLQFAELLGGNLTCDSELGTGSTFTLKIPIHTPRNYIANPTNVDQGHVRLADAPALDDARILVVDDNPDNRQILRYLLEPTGADIEVAVNGAEAIRMLDAAIAVNRAFTLVLLDMQMPVMDGYDAVRFIRKKRLPCRVIAVTAFATTGDREKCMAAGCDDYLSKPVEPATLYAVAAEASPYASDTIPAVQATTSDDLFSDPLFAQLRDAFVESLDRQHTSIHQALNSNDFISITQSAHKLKGTGSSYGFPQVTELASTCERLLLEGADASDAIASLLAELESVIESHRNEPPS
ncbi:MAG: two-component system sensor histidine kinase/response regulator [Planctomycetota bacterium]|jgi:two-component system sensor histidine kinase/response regulator